MTTTNLLSGALQTYKLQDDGTYPNSVLPVILYKGALAAEKATASAIEQLFRNNGWGGDWRNGIYDFHHYHSTSHEVLGIYGGMAQVQLGGPQGILLELSRGDMLVIPAGVAHCNLGSSHDFHCVGAYPPGQEQYDILRGRAVDRPAADERINALPLPDTDPVHGDDGPLLSLWRL